MIAALTKNAMESATTESMVLKRTALRTDCRSLWILRLWTSAECR
jgi:hypothetical protein